MAGGPQGAPYDEVISAVCGDCHGLTLFYKGPIDNLPADDEGPGIGEKPDNIGRPADFKRLLELGRWGCHG